MTGRRVKITLSEGKAEDKRSEASDYTTDSKPAGGTDEVRVTIPDRDRSPSQTDALGVDDARGDGLKKKY